MTTPTVNTPERESKLDTGPNTGKQAPKKKFLGTFVVNQPPNSKSFFSTAFSVLYTSSDRPGQVCKVPIPMKNALEAHAVERRIYERLTPLKLPNLVRVTDMDSHGIWMDHAAHGCLRIVDNEKQVQISMERRIQWCEDVARVLSAVHANGIRHADLSGRNLLVDEDMNILLCDFSGSAIDDTKATIAAEAGYRHPSKNEWDFPSFRCEVHALGSTIYEIVVAHEVYKGIPKENIDGLLGDGKYPPLDGVPLSGIIKKCWSGDFSSVTEVVEALVLARLTPA